MTRKRIGGAFGIVVAIVLLIAAPAAGNGVIGGVEATPGEPVLEQPIERNGVLGGVEA